MAVDPSAAAWLSSQPSSHSHAAAQAKAVLQGGQVLKLPAMCPPMAARIFFECTKMQPNTRPTALDIVHWLREG